jgi:hypothetical protein
VSTTRKIAQGKGIVSWTDTRFKDSIAFSNGHRSTSIPVMINGEAFAALAVLRLINYFPDRLSVNDFWPDR